MENTETRPRLRIATSWDDGSIHDLQLAELLDKYQLPAVFYIPTTCELDEIDIGILKLKYGFEIGGHTVTHPMDMKILDDNQLKDEIEDNKNWLEGLLDIRLTKFCYPRGRYNEKVINALKKAGYEYARTTAVFQNDVIDEFRVGTSIHVFQRSEYNGMPWFEAAKRWAKFTADTNGLFHIWGHSWEITRDKNWDNLEDFFKWLTANYELIKE